MMWGVLEVTGWSIVSGGREEGVVVEFWWSPHLNCGKKTQVNHKLSMINAQKLTDLY